MGHGQLARNSWEIARAGQTVTKSTSCEPMVIETWLTSQNDDNIWFSGSMQTHYTHETTGSASKMHFSDISGPYIGKFWHFPYVKNHSTYEIG